MPIRPDYTPVAQDKGQQAYRRADVLSPTAPSDGILISDVTTEGKVKLTLAGGGDITVNVPLGSSILPFSCTAAAAATQNGAVGAVFTALFFA